MQSLLQELEEAVADDEHDACKGQETHDLDMKRQSSCLSKKDEAPEVLLEDFILKKQIGRGSFGRVYLAELPQTGR